MGRPLDPAYEKHCRQQEALAIALAAWQAEWESPVIIPISPLADYGLALSYSVCESGQFTATLLHVDGGTRDSGLSPTPAAARDLVLGIAHVTDTWPTR